MSRICNEFVPWKPFELVFIPEEPFFSMADLYLSAQQADAMIAWVMSGILDEGSDED